MPAIAPIPPDVLKNILLELGWAIHNEDEFNWALQKDGTPLIVPKKGGVVSLVIMESLFERTGIDLARFSELLQKVGYSYYN